MKKSAVMLACFITAGSVSFAQNTKEAKAPPPPPPPPKVETVKFAPPVIIKDDQLQDFYKRNPSVAEGFWNKKQNFVVKLKDGSTEEYNLSNTKEKENFTGKYGTPLPPLPPPAKKESIKFAPPKIVKDTVDVKEQK